MIQLTQANPTNNVHRDQGVLHASYPVSGTKLSNTGRMSDSDFLERALGQFLITDCSETTMSPTLMPLHQEKTAHRKVRINEEIRVNYLFG